MGGHPAAQLAILYLCIAVSYYSIVLLYRRLKTAVQVNLYKLKTAVQVVNFQVRIFVVAPQNFLEEIFFEYFEMRAKLFYFLKILA